MKPVGIYDGEKLKGIIYLPKFDELLFLICLGFNLPLTNIVGVNITIPFVCYVT
jgi:hypothetical protein